MIFVLLACELIPSHVLPEIKALKFRMVFDNPVVLFADIRSQYGGSNFRVNVDRQHLADVVQQGNKHRFVIGAVVEGQGGRLQRMVVTGNRAAIFFAL